MSDLEFNAALVSVATQDNAWIIGLADDPSDPTNFVILQRAISVDDQDKKLGHDSYHLEVSGQPIGYNCIKNASLMRDKFSVVLNEKISPLLGEVAVAFDISEVEWKDLAEKLQFVFHGTKAEFAIET